MLQKQLAFSYQMRSPAVHERRVFHKNAHTSQNNAQMIVAEYQYNIREILSITSKRITLYF